ncbi:Protein kinase domain-containing protein [Caenorhabditis elegans]|uniref:Protein kinase domain-containing protein n=1 Tax=Caenorhabditis elegans TaxID=6239 RepID=Q19036_CAEEL|nr:Protein kinase domain-containing protein [Caenorhabditis elegans]CCD68599.1 Protein kinase domain-containing protein [Caenorhabditis elegans]|eukprot:NP_505432.2 Uncharacterized protein CELE_E02C12.12 [Caenorhabditis elegans]
MQLSFGTYATFGDNMKATNISDLKGFQSIIALIEPDWIDVEKGKDLPKKFAVKISTQLALAVLSKIMKLGGENGFSEEKLNELGKLIRDGHNREVATYKLLEKMNHPDIPYTKVYGLKGYSDANDLKGFMIMEFIPNVRSIPMYEAILADDLISLVRGIATFAALGETLSEEEKAFAGGPEYLESMFEEVFTDEQLERIY